MPGMDMADDTPHASLILDRLEAFHTRDGNGQALDAQAWYGGDIDKLWLKLDGERTNGRLGATRMEALWNHAIAPYWGLQLGVRHDVGDGPSRNWAAFGVQGLAPYWFEVQATAYVGPQGRTALRFEAEYELLLTQRLVLQPNVKASVYGKRDPERSIGAGLSDVEAGLRLRYEITRKFAPYIGVVWNRKFGGTAATRAMRANRPAKRRSSPACGSGSEKEMPMKPITKHVFATTAVLALGAAAAFAALVYSGVYDFAADDPHTAPVYAVLETMRDRSIDARARKVAVPDLGDPQRVVDGAGNYDAMCAACHLAPGLKETELSKGLYPAPPDLTREKFQPAHAFWVIKHGVKASGMPAWGKSMGDEHIWSLTAFLQKLPGSRCRRLPHARRPELWPFARRRRDGDGHGGSGARMDTARKPRIRPMEPPRVRTPSRPAPKQAADPRAAREANPCTRLRLRMPTRRCA